MRKLYNIDNIISNDVYVYVEINIGIYGLKKAEIIVYLHLAKTWMDMSIIPSLSLQACGTIAP